MIFRTPRPWRVSAGATSPYHHFSSGTPATQDIVVMRKGTAMTGHWALVNAAIWFLFAVWVYALHLCQDDQSDELN
jgi:hypothetical protein